MTKSFFSISAVLTILGGAMAQAGPAQAYRGSSGDEGFYDRVIKLTPDARTVNVTSGEKVKFVDVASGVSFVWVFDTPARVAFDLAAVAPPGILDGRSVMAHVAAVLNPQNG
jgi:hypothetical protein